MLQTMLAATDTLHLRHAGAAPVSARIYTLHDQPVAAVSRSIDLEQLYAKHRVHLLRFVQRYLGNQSDAEDVVQNTFVEAMRCVDHFSGLSKPSTWLFGIALNLARNQVRRNCADRYEEIDDSFLEQIVDSHADPALQCELHQMAGLVDSLLADLPAPIRHTFEAVLDGEMSYDAAAKELGIPIGTVRSRVSRVRAAARRQCGLD
ncbi:RNA polymerase sigma factor [Pseudoduganella violacea]|uniref:RNA polymerase sigma factor n=1 Tax=Pseudoduganella violacea TaxID=1715466 RepID=A0A7W5FWK4_9BURK|nr:RNA polymerase sigma factor [Pseudoduganella violacea]MBB3121954.1 RNA polymerase sigma-70 factor (ECF subfamily) [Pseudoduganella violacea]